MSRKPALWKLNPPKGHFAWSSEEAATGHQQLQRSRALSHGFTDVATCPQDSRHAVAKLPRPVAGATPYPFL